MGRHIYSDIHEYFFVMFSIYAWLTQLTYRKTNFQGGKPTCWTPELIEQLKEVDNRESRAFEVWLENILEGYISDFTVDTIKSYSDTEREFFKGPRGIFLLSLQLWINMLIYEK